MVKGGKVSKVNVKKIVTDQVEQGIRNVALMLAKAQYGDSLEKMVATEKDLTQNPDAVNPQLRSLLDFYNQLTDYINGKDKEESYPANVVQIGNAILGKVITNILKGLYVAGVNAKTKILIAEDEKWYLEGVVDYLKENGYECSIMQEVTGANILEVVLNSDLKFDILMMCIMMHAGSEELKEELHRELREKLQRKVSEEECYTGLTVIRKIREKKPDLPIVVITVVDDPEILKEIRDMGCQVVQKVESESKESKPKEILKAVQEAEKKIPAKTGVRAA